MPKPRAETPNAAESMLDLVELALAVDAALLEGAVNRARDLLAVLLEALGERQRD